MFLTLRDVEPPPPPEQPPAPSGEELVQSDPDWLPLPAVDALPHESAAASTPQQISASAAPPALPELPTLSEPAALPELPTLPELPALDDLPTLTDVAVPPVAPPPLPSIDPLPTHEVELLVSDPTTQSDPWLGDPVAERAAQRAARRAQVRRERARHAADATQAVQQQSTPAMLLLAPINAARGPLHELLAGFGFEVQAMQALPELPAPWPFAVVFVDAALRGGDGSDAIDLCNQVRERARLPGERRPALMLVAESLSATDRVRAGLAGCNEVLVGAVTRGGVAGVLEARGIALPSDARRG